MEKEKIYNRWKAYRKAVPVPGEFSDSVMHQIAAMPQEDSREFLIDKLDPQNRLARMGAAGGLILLGLFRILYILANLIQPQLLVH